MKRLPVVMMGVSGAGKSAVGHRIAELGDREFIDADDLHPPENRRKMAAGIPLSDDDRLPWLGTVATVLRESSRPIVACSALKRSYREQLRADVPGLGFIFLSGDQDTIRERLRARSHAFMPESLMVTQFETLELPEDEPRLLVLDIRRSISELAVKSIEWINQQESPADLEVRE